MNILPFYLDWQFWSTIVALIALILSQLPPLKLLLRKGTLTLEKYRTVVITHTIGSPAVNQFVILKNIGSSNINVHSIDMKVIRKNSESFSLKGRGYALNPSDYNFTMLTPFEVAPNQTWAHTISFTETWDRGKQKQYKILYANIRDTITEKKRSNPVVNEIHEANDDDFKKICDFFNKNYKWFDGEYEAEILVKDKNDNVIAKDLLKFTLFESEVDELKQWAKDYKYGYSIHLPASQKQNPLYIELSE